MHWICFGLRWAQERNIHTSTTQLTAPGLSVVLGIYKTNADSQ